MREILPINIVIFIIQKYFVSSTKMEKEKRFMGWKRISALVLSIAISASMLLADPTLAVAAPGGGTDGEIDTQNGTNGYFVDFADEQDVAGWSGTGLAGKGKGQVSLEDGTLKITSNGGDSQEGNVGVFNPDTPSYTNGYMETKFELTNSEGRIGFLLRADGGQNHVELIYDSQAWHIRKFSGSQGGSNEKMADYAMSLGKTYVMRVEIVNNKLTAVITEENGNPVTICKDRALPSGIEKSGMFGFRAWGSDWGNTGDTHYGSMKIHTIDMGEMDAGETPATPDQEGEYFLDFENTIGRWEVRPDGSEGRAELTDDGRFEVQTVKLAGQENFLTYDADSPDLSNGELSVDVDLKYAAAGRYSFVFRYKDKDNWSAVGYDVGGQWKLFNMKNGTQSNQNIFTYNPNTTYNIRIAFADTDLEVYIDDNQVCRQSGVLSGGEDSAGKMGIRTWGYEGNYAHIIVDNMKYTRVNAVSISPKEVTIRSLEAGEYDIPVRLSSRLNPFEKLTVEDQGTVRDLEKDKDYVVDDSGDTPVVLIKKEYIAQIKDREQTVIHFVFGEGYSTDFTVNMGSDEKAFTYTRDFADGIEGFVLKEGTGNVVSRDGKAFMTGNGIFIDEKSQQSRNNEIEFTFDPKSDSMGMGAVLRYAGPDQDYLWVGPVSQAAQHETVWAITTRSGQKVSWPDGYFVLSDRGKPYRVKVRVVEDVVTVFVDYAETYTASVSGIPTHAGQVGFKSGGSGMSVYGFTQNDAAFVNRQTQTREEVISSDQMSVTVDADFPRVIQYDVTQSGTAMGQENPIHEIELNNRRYVPAVTSAVDGNKITYRMTVNEADMKASFDVVFTVTGNVLDMRITNIQDEQTPIYTFYFPEHSLVSLPDTAQGAELRVNNFQSETVSALSDLSGANTYKATSIAVLSGGGVAASINNGSDKNRQEIAYQTFFAGDHTSTGLWSNEYMYRGLDGEIMEEPWTKVSVTGDRNADGVVDYQDGAIARRDDCYKDGEERLPGSEDVMRSMNMIAMNVGSMAQYPFLRIEDNIKKFYLGTDGFGQNIIIKGYQSEGHDAAHPDYANYNTRAGGLEDFTTLLSDAQQYNANVGVHINDTDIYPEAPQYAEKASSLGGWSWYDTANTINRQKDMLDTGEDGFDARIQNLFSDTQSKLGTVYVDVFFGTRWPMYKISDNIQSDGHGVATEYVDEFVRTSVFGHHIDGRFNTAGNLVRFVYNQDKDVFGSSNLFRGASDRSSSPGGAGFLGWQGAVNYNATIEAFYTKVLPNKFLGQYPVSRYSEESVAVLGENNEVVTKWENGKNVITLNGKVVADGNNIFIPWTTGEGSTAQEKIYFWTNDGSAVAWSLPNGWENLSTVTLYPLSDQGKGEGVEISVSNGRVNLGTVQAKQAYVLYKGKEASKVTETASTMEWSTGSLVDDMGFDSHDFENWTKSSSAGTTDHITIENNNLGNSELRIAGTNDGEVTQILDNLKVGQQYSASVWVTTPEGKRASLTVENGTEAISNYLDDDSLLNGTNHNDKAGTTFQRIAVRFTAQSETAALHLKAAGGASSDAVSRFDDVRVVENQPTDKGSHSYYDDFENVDQGFGPFIPTETAGNTHLSEINDKNPEVTTDVVDGRYSLKIRSGDYVRTAPFTVRFQPETNYSAGLSYKVPGDSSGFTVNVKSDSTGETLASAQSVNNGQVSEIRLEFDTGAADDYYIEVKANGTSEYYIDNFWVDENSCVDVERLHRLYEECGVLSETDYTPESYNMLKEAMDQAKVVLDRGEAAEQAEIDEAYNVLKRARNGLVTYATEGEREKLRKAAEEMEALDSQYYVQDEQWTAFQEVILEAKALAEKSDLTSLEVMEMITRLQEAKERLNFAVDRVSLQAMVDKARAVDVSAMTDGNELQTFITTRDKAISLIAVPEATADQIASVEAELRQAYYELLPKADSMGQSWKDGFYEELLKLADMAQPEWFSSQADYDQMTAAKETAGEMLSDSSQKMKALDEAKTNLEEVLSRRIEFELKLTVSPAEGGTVSGAGSYKVGDTVTVTAQAAQEYTFAGWYAGEEQRNLYPEYTFQVLREEELTARFESQAGSEDTQEPPAAPVNLVAKDVRSDGFTLEWSTAARRSVADGYAVYIDGVELGTTTRTEAVISNLQAGTKYIAEVKAYTDTAGGRLYSDGAVLEVFTKKEDAVQGTKPGETGNHTQSGPQENGPVMEPAKTGDNIPVKPAAAAFLCAALVVGALIFIRRRKKRGEFDE